MRLPFRLVHSFEDVENNFENIEVFGIGGTRGVATVTVAAATQFTVPHNLPSAPHVAFGTPVGWSGYVWETKAPDAANVYFAASGALSANLVHWMAVL